MLQFSISPRWAIRSIFAYSPLKITASLCLAFLCATSALGQTGQWPKEQTAELTALRSSSSPAEKKLSFNLLLLSRETRHASIEPFTSLLDKTVVGSDGTLMVEITAFLSPSLMASPVMADILRINEAISLAAYSSDHLHARLYPWQLLQLAANPNVTSIRDREDTPAASAIASLAPPPALRASR